MTAFARLALLSVLILGTSVAYAQQGRPQLDPEALKLRMAEEAGEVIKHLALEGEKADTVRAVLMSRNEKILALRQKMRAGRERGQGRGLREAMAELDQKTEATLAGLLTETELKAYRAFAAERRLQRRPRRSFR